MIAHLRGTLAEKSFDRIVVDVGGVGYAAHVSMQTLAELPEPGREVMLRTYLQIREDAHVLFAFADEIERRAFELCISVSGIGPKLAIAILSALRPADLGESIRRGDVARLSKTPGIGKKTAERLVVELRDKVVKAGILGSSGGGATAPGHAPTAIEGVAVTVASALVNLGYRADAAERAANEVTKGREDAPLELLLREALRVLTG